MLYEVIFEESPNYNKMDRLYQSVIVKAPDWTSDEDGIILPSPLVDWAKNVFTAQYAVAGEVSINSYAPVLIDHSGVRNASSINLQTFPAGSDVY